jgi:hypothetical protein
MQEIAWNAAHNYDNQHDTQLTLAIRLELEKNKSKGLEIYYNKKADYIESQIKSSITSEMNTSENNLPYIDFEEWCRIADLYWDTYNSEPAKEIKKTLAQSLEQDEKAFVFWVNGHGPTCYQYLLSQSGTPMISKLSYRGDREFRDLTNERYRATTIEVDPSVFGDLRCIFEPEQGILHTLLKSRGGKPQQLIGVPIYPIMQTEEAAGTVPTGLLIVDKKGEISKAESLDRLTACTHDIAVKVIGKSPFNYSRFPTN